MLFVIVLLSVSLLVGVDAGTSSVNVCNNCNATYGEAGQGEDDCSGLNGGSVSEEGECIAAAIKLGKNFVATENVDEYPTGCYVWKNEGVFLNQNTDGVSEETSSPICKSTGTSSVNFCNICNATYGEADEGEDDCSGLNGGSVSEEIECRFAAMKLGKNFLGTENVDDYPTGCYVYNTDDGDDVFLNLNTAGGSNFFSSPICKSTE